MIKFFILFTIMWFGTITLSQTTFSIAPLISYKLHTCSYPIDEFFGFSIENKNIQPQNPYYNFDVKRVSGRPAIDMGVRFQASFKDNKHLLLLEWSQDAMGTMSKTSELVTTNLENGSLPPYNTYSAGTSYFHTGFTFNRFSFQYGRRITNKLSIARLYLLTDLSLTFGKYNRADWRYENWPENTSVYYHNNARWVSTDIMAEYWGGTSFLMGLGIRGDILLPLKKKTIYLFTLEGHYRQGFKTMGHSSHTTVIDDSGQIAAFFNTIVSRGSGIYFQISRNFQLYPWRPNKKAKNVE